MHSYQHSRGRILFEVACAFGISASCVEAWLQTYATAMLPVAGIAALYGLVHAFDMFRRTPVVDVPQGIVAPAPEPAAVEQPVVVESSVEAAVAPDKKRKRKAPKSTASAASVREVQSEARPEPEPEAIAPVVEAEPEPVLHVVDTAPDEPEYVPAAPLFEAEPYVRMQRAAFGRKAR